MRPRVQILSMGSPMGPMGGANVAPWFFDMLPPDRLSAPPNWGPHGLESSFTLHADSDSGLTTHPKLDAKAKIKNWSTSRAKINQTKNKALGRSAPSRCSSMNYGLFIKTLGTPGIKIAGGAQILIPGDPREPCGPHGAPGF